MDPAARADGHRRYPAPSQGQEIAAVGHSVNALIAAGFLPFEFCNALARGESIQSVVDFAIWFSYGDRDGPRHAVAGAAAKAGCGPAAVAENKFHRFLDGNDSRGVFPPMPDA